MGDSVNNNSSEIQPVCVLLPFCVELENDVFLNILRLVVGRLKLDGHDDIEALKSGMTDDVLYVKSNDLMSNWKDLDSKPQRFQQLKLFGFWAARNFPSLSKKLLGEQWQGFQGKRVEVIEDPMMPADEIESLISQKMQIRIMELNVSNSTLDKIKHFVKTPISIEKFNRLKITQKINSFEVKVDHIQRCWEALKCGKFSLNKISEQGSVLRTPEYGEYNASGTNDSCSEPVRKRSHTATTENKPEELDRAITNRKAAVNVVKRVNSNASTRAEAKTKRQCVDATSTPSTADIIDAASNGSLWQQMLDMKNEIGTVSNWVSNEIAGKRTTVEQLQQEKEDLEKIQSDSQERIQKQSSLIDSLQQGIEATSKLHTKSEIELAASLDLIQKLKTEIAEKNASNESNEQFKIQIEELNGKVAEAVNSNQEWKNYSAAKDAELLSWKSYATSKDEEIITLNKTLSDMRSQIESSLLENRTQNELNAELKIENQDLNRKLSEAQQLNRDDVNKWKNYASSKDEEVIAQNKTICEFILQNQKLKESLLALTNKSASVVNELNSTIENLDKKLTELKIVNCETMNRNERLNQELNVLKNCSAETRKHDEMEQELGAHNQENDIEPVDSDSKSSDNQELNSTFVTDNASLKEIRDHLQTLQFGWMKFRPTKSSAFNPGFLHPGICRAQKVNADGWVCNTKSKFYEFADDIPDELKGSSQKSALIKLNERFKFSFI